MTSLFVTITTITFFSASLCHVMCDLDEWQFIFRGGGTATVIATNNRALYALFDGNLYVHVLSSAGKFQLLHSEASHLAVNDDFQLWIARPDHIVYLRIGITADNLLGNSWWLVDGHLSRLATARKGQLFATNVYHYIYSLRGMTSARPRGTSWGRQPGRGDKIACAKRACVVISSIKTLFTTGLLPDGNSPMMQGDWLKIDSNVLDVSAYGDRTLWKLDTAGVAWEAVDVIDSAFRKVHWERRAGGKDASSTSLTAQLKFKDIAVTDKKAYALSEDGRIYVRTGCPIFDFEDDDLTAWTHTGSAFLMQPVIGQAWGDAKLLGHSGKRLIDTYWKKPSDLSGNTSTLVGNSSTGSVKSPLFQIRTSYLHFSIGGGSPPDSYVTLLVDGKTIQTTSGRGVFEETPSGTTRLTRFWWNVGNFVGKCAKLIIHDLSNQGSTQFDDLRESPPCFKRMKATWMTGSGSDVISVGKTFRQTLKLAGFTTNRLRKLIVTIYSPTALDGMPLIYFERGIITWTHCESNHIVTETKLATLSPKRPNQLSLEIVGLLSDALLEVVSRVYDHDALLSSMTPSMTIHVNYANEFIARYTRPVNLTRHGNETAHLHVESWIDEVRAGKGLMVGDNVTLIVRIGHNLAQSLQRAYAVNVVFNVPSYLTVLKFCGSVDDDRFTLRAVDSHTRSFASSMSQHVVQTRELWFGDSLEVAMVARIDGADAGTPRNAGNRTGDLVLDATYCVRGNCSSVAGIGSSGVVWLLKNKALSFAYSERPVEENGDRFSVIIDKSSSLMFVCGQYSSFKNSHNDNNNNRKRRGRARQNCYFKPALKQDQLQGRVHQWMGLGLMLTNISLYDSNRGELYGEYATGNDVIVKLYGPAFAQKHLVTAEQWDEVTQRSNGDGFSKPMHVSSSFPIVSEASYESNNFTVRSSDGSVTYIGPDGLGSSLANAVTWAANLKWRCCH
eukprot:gene19512-21442_t